MKHPRTQPHEYSAHHLFYHKENGLSPYHALWQAVQRFDGGFGKDSHQSFEIENRGDTIEVIAFYYQQGELQPDSTYLDVDDVNEYRIVCRGPGKIKASYHVTPRWPGIESKSGGFIPHPRDIREGAVDVEIKGSNLEPDRYNEIYRSIMSEVGVNPSYFQDHLMHDMGSRVSEYERYVRVEREQAKKLVQFDGIFHQLWQLLLQTKKGVREFRADDSEVEGHLYRVELDQENAPEVLPMQQFGKQIKHYHPEHPQDDPTGPLYHPKVGAALKQRLNDGAVLHKNLDDLERELEELVFNVLRWGDFPVDTGAQYVADDHFEPTSHGDPVAWYDNPVPEIQRYQNDVVKSFARENHPESDVETLKLVADGGQPQPEEIAAETDYSLRTIYNCLDRCDDLITNTKEGIRPISRKLQEDIKGMIEGSLEYAEETAEIASEFLELYENQLRDGQEALMRWLERYAARLEYDEDRYGQKELVCKIGAPLSRYVGADRTSVPEAIAELLHIWTHEIGRPRSDIKDAWVEHDALRARTRIRQVHDLDRARKIV